ncbi:MAG: SURF1 family protein [Caldilineaceae bacterium]
MSEVLSVFKTMFNRRWWWKTLIVIAAMIFMAGLGNWQLQRLDQRRAYNAELLAKLASDPIVVDGGPLPEEPADLVDRRATVSGTYDFAGQISIKNQSHMGQPGVHLVTPFHIDGSDHAILINRGWVPYQQGTSALWGQFDEAAQATLSGYLQKSQKMPDGSTTAVNETPQEAWFRLDIEAIQTQIGAAHARLPGFGAGGRASVDGAAGAHPAGDGYQRGQSHELRHPVVFFRPHRRDRLLRCRASSGTATTEPVPNGGHRRHKHRKPVAL